MPANPSGDDDTPVRGKEPVPAEVDPASPETRAAERGRSPGLRPRAGRPIGMAGPFGGAQHLVDDAFGPRRAEIGSTEFREGGCQYLTIPVRAGPVKKQIHQMSIH